MKKQHVIPVQDDAMSSVDGVPVSFSEEGSDRSSQFHINLGKRHLKGFVWRIVFQIAIIIGIISLTALIYNIINESFGFIAVKNEVDPVSLSIDGVPLEQLSKEQFIEILKQHISPGLFRRYDHDQPFSRRSRMNVYELVKERVVNPHVVESWTLTASIFKRSKIRDTAQEMFPDAELYFRSWLNVNFLRKPQSSTPEKAGVRSAVLGSLWTIFFTILFAFPIGVGAAIYLEEYAKDNVVNRIIQTNIYNLAGVPSIIYGILGLAIFVRALEPLTSGSVFGITDPTTSNGRTILTAGLTLALLILPIIIINSQEAIRAVPQSLRHSSYGVGATKWQTIWYHVLPVSFDRILTGTILSISRAIGETAPLVVVGASTFVTMDPKGPFSKFTTLPIQIYQWTARPQGEFRNVAAAAILVLLLLLLSLNASAVLLRNYYSKKKRLL